MRRFHCILKKGAALGICAAVALQTAAAATAMVAYAEPITQDDTKDESEEFAVEDDLDEEETENEDIFVPSQIAGPVFSAPSGFYEEAFTVTIDFPDGYNEENADIFFSTDGSIPIWQQQQQPEAEENQTDSSADDSDSADTQTLLPSTAKDRKIEVKMGESKVEATILRAVLVTADGEASDVVTMSYFCKNDMTTYYDIPLISVVADPDDLYDPETGIIKNRKESGREWERPATFQYFEVGGALELDQGVGIRVHGGASRDFKFKSLRIYARKEYDTQNTLDYDFFSESLVPAVTSNGERETIDSFKRLILRNSGNEGGAWQTTLVRDPLVQSALADGNSTVNLQAYRPAVVYLNGKYDGILNIRERYDEHYLEEHYGKKEEDYTIFDFWYDGKTMKWSAKAGPESENDYFQEFYDFLKESDFSKDENYEKLGEYLDLENAIDYFATQIYCGNSDWPGNNMRMWRYNKEASEEYGLDGKLRFLLYDTEFSLGLYGASPTQDFLAYAKSTGSSEWPRPEDSTLMFRAIMANEQGRVAFAGRYMDLLNSTLSNKEMTERLNQLTKAIEKDFPEYREKSGVPGDDLEGGKKEVQNFISRRGAFAFSEIRKHCEVGESYSLKVAAAAIGLESIDVNSIHGITAENVHVMGGMWSGDYTTGVPVTITVHAAPGYRFVCWNNDETLTDSTIVISGKEDTEKEQWVPSFEEIPKEELTTAADETDENGASQAAPGADASGSSNQTTTVSSVLIGLGAALAAVAVIFALLGVSKMTNKKKEK